MTSAPARRLLLSVHDVSPAHAERISRLTEVIERRAGESPFAMLVVPDFHGGWPLAAHPAFRAWLRARADAGVEMFLHGLRHLDESRHATAMSRWKAGVMTAGEGEFLGLDRAEADRRLRDGRAELEDIIGRPVAGFVAPAWLYGPGALAAIAAQGFALAEDHFKVWRPSDGRVLARGPVITYATRTPARLASSLMVSRAATLGLRRLTNLRLAVHPHDVESPAVMREFERALAHYGSYRRISRYADLAA
ncbi:MAG TPA: polysaccharide deacetylase family protein [Caulobacteraceae bacterium]|jgi:predicted deacetylase|nr:polysaccharide deacetylase family protein [Caulobacteraceae bacterium]